MTVDNFVPVEGDLDLELRSAAGIILDTSAGISSTETAEFCNSGASASFYGRVFGYLTAQNSYNFTATVAPDPDNCCTVDPGEEDDTQGAARSVMYVSDVANFDGTWCTGDDDWVEIPMSGPGTIEVNLVFIDAEADIDIALHSPSGTRLASSTSVSDDESFSHDVGAAGTYALRIYGVGSGAADYLGEIRRTAGAGCMTTDDCPAMTVCDGGSCVSNVCSGTGSCPTGHTCMSGGPIPAANVCGLDCMSFLDCRTFEWCKWSVDGRACGASGSRGVGDSCTSLADCVTDRTCVAWPGGYCARVGCNTQSDCGSNAVCINRDGMNICAFDCEDGFDSDCRQSEDYECWPHSPGRRPRRHERLGMYPRTVMEV